MKQRFEKLRVLLGEKLSVYPILIGILFITTELHKNWTISTSINKVLFAFIIIAFCLAVNFLSVLFIKNKIKASLIVLLIIVFNLYYQYLYNWIYELGLTKLLLDLLITIHPGRYIGSFLSIICFVLLILIIKARKNLFSLNLYLNIVISFFLVFEVGSIIFTKPFVVELIPSSNLYTGKLINSIIKDKPNIYFILLDAYTSSASLKKYWGYDNSPFEDSLANMGFYNTHSSKSDYDCTYYCIASYLNMSLLKLNPKKPKNELWLHPDYNTLDLIKKNTVTQRIINSGYIFANYSIFDIDNFDNSNCVWKPNDPESLNKLYERTSWLPIINKIQQMFYQTPESGTLSPNLKLFHILKDSIASDRNVPIFVYAHIMMPHQPFEFDENGNKMSYQYSEILENESYLKQLRYTNTLVIETIRKILASENKKPIIIIQGDHGYRFLKNVDLKNRRIEAHSILSSYLFPKDLSINLNDSINPIQALSLLFNSN